MGRADFSEEVTSEWRLEGWEGASCIESRAEGRACAKGLWRVSSRAEACDGAEQREEKTQRWLEADLRAMRVTVGEFRFYSNCSGRAWGALNR